MVTDLSKEAHDIVAMEVEEEELETPSESNKEPAVVKRGRLEEQRQALNTLFGRADRATAVFGIPQFRQSLIEADFSELDMDELLAKIIELRDKDQVYVLSLRERRKATQLQMKAAEQAVEQIRKAKRRGRNLISERPELKDEFCIGVQLSENVPSIRYQGPLVLLAAREHFDDLPRYSETDLQHLAQSLTSLETAVVAKNHVTIKVRQTHRAREAAMESLREELSDLRLAAEIAEETTSGILQSL